MTVVPPVRALAGVVTRRAVGAEAVARLRRQAEVLDRARHPGVVELVDVVGGDEWAELRTATVPGPSLAAAGRLTPDELAGVVAALSATLADLHALGIVHGRVAPDDVILRPDGRPVLSGFDEAGRAGDHRPAGGALRPADDVEALGRLVAATLEGGGPGLPGEPWQVLRARLSGPSSRRRRWIRRSRWFGGWRHLPGHPVSAALGEPAAAVLAELAHRATHPDPDERPTAADLSAEVHRRVGSARLPRRGGGAADGVLRRDGPTVTPPETAGGRRPASDPRGRARRLGLAAALAAAVVATSAVVVARSGPPAATAPMASSPPPSPLRTAPPEPDGGIPLATQVWPTTTAPAGTCPTDGGDGRIDLDADKCDETISFAGGVLHAGTARYALGRDGDVVATGDWDCDGRATVALLRPATGDVFAFDRWAAADEPVTGRWVSRVAGATALVTADGDGDGCRELLAVAPGGSSVVVAAKAAP